MTRRRRAATSPEGRRAGPAPVCTLAIAFGVLQASWAAPPAALAHAPAAELPVGDDQPAAPSGEQPRDAAHVERAKHPRKRDGKVLIASGAALTGVGTLLALGGGIGFGVAAKRKSDEVDDVALGGNPEQLTFDEAQSLADEGKRLEIGQIAMAAAGGAIAIVGAVLLGIGLRNRSSRAAGAGKTAFVPTWNPRFVGASLTGRF